MRTVAAVAALVVVLAGTGSARVEERFLDGVVAEVDGAVVTASDVALGRALGLFGLRPATGPLSVAEIRRYLDGRLLVREAARIGAEESPADPEDAWTAVVRRAGGESALRRWLAMADVEAAWARRLVVDDLRMRRFVELRFRALAFVSEVDLATALGPGEHDEAARAAMRARLEADTADRRLAEWLADARGRARLSPRIAAAGQAPDPLPALSDAAPTP